MYAVQINDKTIIEFETSREAYDFALAVKDGGLSEYPVKEGDRVAYEDENGFSNVEDGFGDENDYWGDE